MASRKKKDRRKQKKRDRGLASRPPLPRFPGGMPHVIAPPDDVKMSQVLLEFLEPYADEWETAQELSDLVAVATLAWNATFAPVPEREQYLQSVLDTVPPAARDDVRGVVLDLMRRKIALFGEVRRMVLDYQVTETADGPHLSVMSTFPPPSP